MRVYEYYYMNVLTYINEDCPNVEGINFTKRQTMTIRSYRSITPSFDSSVYVDESAVLIGDIKLGEQSSIWPLVAGRGDVNVIRIGQRTNVQDGSVLHVTRKSPQNPTGFPLLIGDDVTVGHKCMLHGCQLGNRILVGMGAIIMDGAVVQDDVFIAAGSLVAPNKVLESGYLYVGNPAVKKRLLKNSEMAFLKQSAINYVELSREYLGQ
ncbi:MAG: carbonic anhydrase/acetyltransferase-like protein (isoleucine patch superfamily) [Glaciecola sp.]|jgi:carbonic anhydrase/acetyltransferase-like protein (isoleucine patch superfamily)